MHIWYMSHHAMPTIQKHLHRKGKGEGQGRRKGEGCVQVVAWKKGEGSGRRKNNLPKPVLR